MSNAEARGLKHSALLSPGWTSPLPCPPDCSYQCSLLFQGAFLDCSGPLMLVIPSFLHPSYPTDSLYQQPVFFPSPSWLVCCGSRAPRPILTGPPKPQEKSSFRLHGATFLTFPFLPWAAASVFLPKTPKNCGRMGSQQDLVHILCQK